MTNIIIAALLLAQTTTTNPIYIQQPNWASSFRPPTITLELTLPELPKTTWRQRHPKIYDMPGAATFRTAVKPGVFVATKTSAALYNFSQKPKIQHTAQFADTMNSFVSPGYFIKGLFLRGHR